MSHDSPTATNPVSILIIDDHPMLAEALRLSLGGDAASGIEVLVADDFDCEAVLILAASTQPDVVLVDLDLGGQRAGVELIDPLTRAGHRVVLFTGATRPSLLGDGLVAGASGVLRKSEPFQRLIEGITDAAHGRSVTRPSERDELIAASSRSRAVATRHDARLDALTPRERDILQHLAQGRTAAEIAADDFVSITTVRSQIKAILRKLGVSSQLAAVAFAQGVEGPART